MKKYICWLCCVWCLAACGTEKTFSPDDGEMQQAKQVLLFESKDSQSKWILHADAVNFEDTQHAVLTNPRLLLREQGQDSLEVSGRRGRLNYSKKLVSIEGNAVVHSLTEQATLKTERFFYDIDKDRVWSDQKTFIDRAHTHITARGGIETDSKLRKIQLKKQTTQLPDDPQELKGVGK